MSYCSQLAKKFLNTTFQNIWSSGNLKMRLDPRTYVRGVLVLICARPPQFGALFSSKKELNLHICILRI